MPSAADGLLALSRLLALASDPATGASRLLQAAVAQEARALLAVPAAAVVDLRDRARPNAAAIVATREATSHRSVPASAPAIGQARATTGPLLAVDPARALELSGLLGQPDSLTLLPLPAGDDDPDHLLVLAGPPQAPPELAIALAAAAAAAFARLRAASDEAGRAVRQAALTRAAKTLHEPLDVPTLLARVCEEAAALLDADSAAILAGSADDRLTVRSAYGLPAEALGWRLPPDSGMLGDEATLAEDYEAPPD